MQKLSPEKMLEQLKIEWSLNKYMKISVTSPCPENTIKELGIKEWPIWTCNPSTFPWTYED